MKKTDLKKEEIYLKKLIAFNITIDEDIEYLKDEKDGNLGTSRVIYKNKTYFTPVLNLFQYLEKKNNEIIKILEYLDNELINNVIYDYYLKNEIIKKIKKVKRLNLEDYSMNDEVSKAISLDFI